MIKKTTKKNKMIGFDDFNNKLDRVIDTMATKSDIKRLDKRIDKLDAKTDRVIDTMATRDDLYAVEARLDRKIDTVDEKHTQKFSEILTAVDGIATRLDRKDLADAVVDNRLDRHEGWAKTFAKKLDVKLQY